MGNRWLRDADGLSYLPEAKDKVETLAVSTLSLLNW